MLGSLIVGARMAAYARGFQGLDNDMKRVPIFRT